MEIKHSVAWNVIVQQIKNTYLIKNTVQTITLHNAETDSVFFPLRPSCLRELTGAAINQGWELEYKLRRECRGSSLANPDTKA